MTPVEEIQESYLINDLETLKALSDPLRMKIMEALGLANDRGTLLTVKQIAEAVDTPPQKLYYHMSQLEKHGLIKVSETQVVSGIIEKHYQVTTRSILVDPELFKSGLSHSERVQSALNILDTIFNATRDELVKLMSLADTDDELKVRLKGRRAHLSRELARMSQRQADAFYEKLAALSEEFEQIEPEEGEETFVFSMTTAFLPTARDHADSGIEIDTGEQT